MQFIIIQYNILYIRLLVVTNLRLASYLQKKKKIYYLINITTLFGIHLENICFIVYSIQNQQINLST